MKLNVTLERDEDGVWVVECPSIPGCVSQGQTKAEALENIKDAMTACLQVRAERGLPLTIEKNLLDLAGQIQLTPNFDHKALRDMDYQRWDEQLEQDAADGKLDALAAEAIAEFNALRPSR
jgi:predicted RNase H-like HicB family nuclease